jgi:hypothetical protein
MDGSKGREVISVEDVARVLAWSDGGTPDEVAAAPTTVLWLDAAQQCLEDIGGAS